MIDNDKFLDTLFYAGRDTPEQLDDAFLTRVQVQAELAVPVVAPIARPRSSLWSTLLDKLGSYSAGASLITATVAGVMIGVNPPDFVLDITTVYFGSETLADLTGELLLDDYFTEDT